MKALEKIINQFYPTSLKEMDNVKLLNRVDTKFVCSVFKLTEILKDLIESYKVLEINDQRIMSYRTKYYDTSEFKMFHEHQNGKLNRYKVREREYVNSDLSFLEIKFKSNKSRTLKSRIVKPESNACFSNKEIDFLDYKSPFSSQELEVKLYNSFQRITLSNTTERVTIDFKLKFENDSGSVGLLPLLAIIEVKQDKYSINSEVVKVLKKYRVRPCSFSKYCIGTAMIYPKLKSNNFKSKFLLINKLTA
ncbi:MAG: polyphosphate polymerase domain-containing protein [Bacteroidales bacterium]|nr:polyphosphate polymerase domain-containing protein [Bacteroidales bacterium]